MNIRFKNAYRNEIDRKRSELIQCAIYQFEEEEEDILYEFEEQMEEEICQRFRNVMEEYYDCKANLLALEYQGIVDDITYADDERIETLYGVIFGH